MPHANRFFPFLGSMLLLLAGCATTGTPLGPSVARNDLPPGTPAASAILADLAKNAVTPAIRARAAELAH